MAIQLKDHNRSITPKSGKYKNCLLIQDYKRRFNYCENCAIFGIDIFTGLELHHIEPGTNRVDRAWNIIHLCHSCHNNATIHKNGSKAILFNSWLSGIKYLKKEISDNRLKQLNKHKQTLLAVSCLKEPFERWRKGLLN
jgi:hypothetical protein